MADSIQAVSSSITALTEQYATITQNIANASTAGYKRRANSFSQLLASQGGGAATAPMAGLAQLPASKVVERSSVDFTQGGLHNTGQPFDLAINGTGFFVIETPEGPLYTRAGCFRMNSQGQLVDYSGRTVGGEGGPITIPANVASQDVKIGADGQVYAAGSVVGKVRIVDFADTSVLQPVGQNCFSAGMASPQESSASIAQGYQEASNVSMVEELVGLITVTRLYEANLKNVQVQDEKMKNLLGVAMR